MLKIAMDSAGDIPAGWEKNYQIDIIPINIHFGDETFLEGIDLTSDQFYQMVRKLKTIPKTSQPTPQQFIDFYNRIAKSGETIFSIHVTSKLSGTYDSAVIAAKELVGKLNIIPIDSRAGSASQGYMCKEAREMDRDGFSIEEIQDRMKFISENTRISFALDTLEFARLSGRVKALQAAIASALRVKPIINLKNGVLEMGEKVRTRKKALHHLVNKVYDQVGDASVNAAVVHAGDPIVGSELMELTRENINCKNLIMAELSTGIAANLGPGTVGLVVYPENETLSGGGC